MSTSPQPATPESVADALSEARDRSLRLLDPLDDAAQRRQHSPLMSPLVWDLAHIGNYEDLWLVRALGADGIRPDIDELYDAFLQPRKDRPQLPLLDPVQARRYIGQVRDRALEVITGGALESGSRLVLDGAVYAMVSQHEHQHIETMLATLQLMQAPYEPATRPAPRRPESAQPPAEVLVPGGPFAMGTDDARTYDNERPAHRRHTKPFLCDTVPVTNRAYIAFIEDGGYDDRRLWQRDGWRWRHSERAEAPLFWRRDGDTWLRRRFGIVEEVPGDEPVQHVCWFEADAFARWAGRRLPTEVEWEKACRWNPRTDSCSRFPWGDGEPTDELATLGGSSFGPSSVGAHPAGASPTGVAQMIGDVWEWTASTFQPHPGFRSFPYPEYSEVFLGDRFRVLRGGSWATHLTATRGTFRNWDYPVRRQIFAGFRTVRDLPGDSSGARRV